MNSVIISNLQVLENNAKASKSDTSRFRVKAYQKAIKLVKEYPKEIKNGQEAIALGIGKKIAEHIDEILQTGQLQQVSSDKVEENNTLTLFTKIWGVGPVKAKELYGAGARSITDVSKYSELLTDNQKIGLKYFNELQKRIPREQVEYIVKLVKASLQELVKEKGWNINMQICGSYRRQAATCGDMDILLCESSGEKILKQVVAHLQNAGILAETLGIGETKYLGITKTSDSIAFRIDIEIIRPEEWPFALLYFTGSGTFNEKQRMIAKKMGYSLSEHGLKNVTTGEYLSGFTCERDIFNFLGMKYLPPQNRS